MGARPSRCATAAYGGQEQRCQVTGRDLTWSCTRTHVATAERRLMRSRSQDRHGLDFDQEFRRSQGAHLDQGRNRKVPGKKLAPCLPDFFAARDIGDKDVHLDDVIHVATSRLYEVLNLGEHSPSLLVHTGAPDDLSARTSGHAGREHLVPHDETVRPGLRGWFGNMRTTHALLRWHRLLLLIIVAWWTSEATELTFEQCSKMDRGAVLQIGANRLQSDRQTGARQTDRKRRCWLAAERGNARIDELQVIGDGNTVHCNGVREVAGLARPRKFEVREGRDQRDGCKEHIPLPEEGTVRGAILLALPIPGEVVTNTGQPSPPARLRERIVVPA